MGGFHYPPFGLRIRSADTASRIGVLNESLPVPNQLAVIEGILQHAVLTHSRTRDRRSIPGAPARARHTLAVQSNRDIAWRLAVDVFRKNTADDKRLRFDNSEVTLLSANQLVSVGPPASRTAGLNDTGEAATNVEGQRFEGEGAEKCANATF